MSSQPDTIVVISPHAHLEPYYFAINSASELVGNFIDFGLDKAYSYVNDISIADSLAFACSIDANDVPVFLQPNFLDYGALIPLYHPYKKHKTKSLASFFFTDELRIPLSLRRDNTQNSLIGAKTESQSLQAPIFSHRLIPNAPAGFSPRAQELTGQYCIISARMILQVLWKWTRTLLLKPENAD